MTTAIDIRRLARLARIDIDGTDEAAVGSKLASILKMIDELQAVDTTGVLPMAHAHDVASPLREDRVTESDQHERFQSGAPSTQDGLYLVPKVIE
ncbi:MAG: Asp-tRNA(Asn)/Glu-tRNA(Gln) amidotransferase subunit GatC [Pseudomonadota bacterium]|nr:Asp-tRNA(Asn)/Glu-tRNA(Gln) amidotransferase subunit GatC [Pseudomonadota bacterium]